MTLTWMLGSGNQLGAQEGSYCVPCGKAMATKVGKGVLNAPGT